VNRYLGRLADQLAGVERTLQLLNLAAGTVRPGTAALLRALVRDGFALTCSAQLHSRLPLTTRSPCRYRKELKVWGECETPTPVPGTGCVTGHSPSLSPTASYSYTTHTPTRRYTVQLLPHHSPRSPHTRTRLLLPHIHTTAVTPHPVSSPRSEQEIPHCRVRGMLRARPRATSRSSTTSSRSRALRRVPTTRLRCASPPCRSSGVLVEAIGMTITQCCTVLHRLLLGTSGRVSAVH
jgi:hypothetical protein